MAARKNFLEVPEFKVFVIWAGAVTLAALFIFAWHTPQWRVRQRTDGSEAPALSIARPVEAVEDKGFFLVTPGAGESAQAEPAQEPVASTAFDFGDFQKVQRIGAGQKIVLEGFVFGNGAVLYQGAVRIPPCPRRSNPPRSLEQVLTDGDAAIFGGIVACHSASFVFFGHLQTGKVAAFNILVVRSLADFPTIIEVEGRSWPLVFANTPEGPFMGVRALDP